MLLVVVILKADGLVEAGVVMKCQAWSVLKAEKRSIDDVQTLHFFNTNAEIARTTSIL